jgi:ketosteroid isomerase-like protein
MDIDLRTLGDRIAIEDCIKRYAHLIDSGQADHVAREVFTDDADITLGGIHVVGRDAIHGALTGMTDSMAGVSHNITNILVEVRGDEAVALSRIIGWHWFARPDADPFGQADLVAIGGYQDRLRRTPDGWRIHHRRGMNFGTGIGIGRATEELKPVFQGMWGRKPEWPVQ